MHAGPQDSVFFCIDASNGAQVWNFTAQYNGAWISSSPAVAYGNVYVGSAEGSIYVFGSSQPSPPLPPEIKFVSPKNQTYNASSVPLVFTVNEPISWAGYSLDSKENVTVRGNFTLTDLPSGLHTLRVYANDTFGKMGVSMTTQFTVAVPETRPELLPTVSVAVAVGVGIVVVVVGSLVYLKKSNRQKTETPQKQQH